VKSIDLRKSKVPQKNGETNQLLDFFFQDNKKIILDHGKRRKSRNKFGYLPENNWRLTIDEVAEIYKKKAEFRSA
jgi:hypothetical protein